MSNADNIPAFFARSGLGWGDVEACLHFARESFPAHHITPLVGQGACSFTLLCASRHTRDQAIVQFRRREHALPPHIACDAQLIFGTWAPRMLWCKGFYLTDGSSVQVCAMTRVPGVGFGDVQPCRRRLDGEEVARLRGLMEDLARFWAKGWNAARQRGERKSYGRIGSTVVDRLRMLECHLPSAALRRKAARLLDTDVLNALSELPVVLSHGDLLSGNIMVDPLTWELRGLVDWAEAEYLPFGMNFYGIEHLLSYFDRAQVVFYQQEHELRESFVSQLLVEIPELKNQQLYQAMLVARDVGVFLWHGIAWDDGKLDRVVNERDDSVEMACLEAYLGVVPGHERSKL